MIKIENAPFWGDEEYWLNEMEKHGYFLIAVLLHSLSNEKKYYFYKEEDEPKKDNDDPIS